MTFKQMQKLILKKIKAKGIDLEGGVREKNMKVKTFMS